MRGVQVVKYISPDSIIGLGDDGHIWDQGPSVFADNMARSRFCFCPRGDTISSRRIFDAVSAGCIPVITTEEVEALPFQRTGMNYSDFAVVTEQGSFGTTRKVAAIVKDLSTRSDAQLANLLEGLERARTSLVYGVSTGPTLADMKPYHGTGSRFLQAAKALVDDVGLWTCPNPKLNQRSLAKRTAAEFPPPEGKREQWLHESETIVNMKHSLLFCAPPNTGSLQFRMLAKRMKGVGHWAVSDDQSLLFDPVASQLPLLDMSNTLLMNAIYKDNGNEWIKIGVVRDPVTRLLSAYLDLVRKWSYELEASSTDHNPQQPHRGLRSGDGWEWFDAIRKHRSLKGGEAEQGQLEEGDHRRPSTWGEDGEGWGLRGSGDGPRGLQDEAAPAVPTFEEILDLLSDDVWTAPSAFRPAASLCGMWQSPFDTIIPFETLQHTSTKVLKSLPGRIWQSFGESGWGPDGKHAFMEFDYGTAVRHDVYADQDAEGHPSNEAVKQEQSTPTASPRARDLSANGSCAWTEYYADQAILDKVGRVYGVDFEFFGWYDIESWKERLEACLKGRQ
ncbi:unnamed protein product [Laminaria digitata]